MASTIPTEREREQLRTLFRTEADLVDALADLVADFGVLEQRAAVLIQSLRIVRAEIRNLERVA